MTNEIQHDLDNLGIAKNAREEKQRARAMKLSDQENERMAKLYRQHVLKEEATPDTQIVQLQIKKAKPESAPAGFGD
jgi:7,8-dihydro-6-hydroxymethylpterin dimethyltransferase